MTTAGVWGAMFAAERSQGRSWRKFRVRFDDHSQARCLVIGWRTSYARTKVVAWTAQWRWRDLVHT